MNMIPMGHVNDIYEKAAVAGWGVGQCFAMNMLNMIRVFSNYIAKLLCTGGQGLGLRSRALEKVWQGEREVLLNPVGALRPM